MGQGKCFRVYVRVNFVSGSGQGATPETDSESRRVSTESVDLPVTDEMKVLGVFLDRRLAFDKHVSAVARSCNYHVQAMRDIRHLMLTTELAQTHSL